MQYTDCVDSLGSGNYDEPDMIRLLLNILWIIFGGGFLIWIEYVLVGLILCLTVVGIPFGMQCFKLAGLSLLPFGKDVDIGGGSVPILGTLGNIIWLLVAGIWIFLSHVGLAI